jgi:hypothetical protein
MRSLKTILLVGLLISLPFFPLNATPLAPGNLVPLRGYCNLEAVDAIIEQAKKSGKRGEAMVAYQISQKNCHKAVDAPFLAIVLEMTKTFLDVYKSKFEIWKVKVISFTPSIDVYIMNREVKEIPGKDT